MKWGEWLLWALQGSTGFWKLGQKSEKSARMNHMEVNRKKTSRNANSLNRYPEHQNELPKMRQDVKSFVESGNIREWARQRHTHIIEFDNVCILRNETQRIFLVNNKLLHGVVLQEGTWGNTWGGPLPAHQPLRLAVWSDLQMRQVEDVYYEKDFFGYELFLRMRFPAENIYHSFADVGNLDSIFWTLQKTNTDQLGLLASQFFAEDQYIEFSLVRSMCGNCPILLYRPPPSSRSPTICYRKVFVSVSDQLVHSQPNLRKELEKQTEPAITIVPEDAWAQTLGLPPVSISAGEQPRIVIIDRMSSRHLLNLGYVVNEMKKLGWSVKTVQLELLSLEEQFGIIRNATTLIGTHGAGLSWGRYLHEDAALIQLVGFPCEFESHSKMSFRRRYKIVASDARATSRYHNTSSARVFCHLMTRFFSEKFPSTANFSTKLHLANFSNKEAATLMERPLDVREYDVVVDIPALLDAITQLDVAASTWRT